MEEAIKDSDLFIVDVTVSADKSIAVEVDSPGSLDIDTCSALTRKIEELLPAELEDYDLEVGSAGLTAPFKVRGQWEKNLGNEIELLTNDGRKLAATLAALGDDSFTVEYQSRRNSPAKSVPPLSANRRKSPSPMSRRPITCCDSNKKPSPGTSQADSRLTYPNNNIILI